MWLAAQQLDLPAAQLVYVGDHPRDIDAGRAAGMLTVLAAWGYLPPDHRHDLDAWQAGLAACDVAAHRGVDPRLTDQPHHLLVEPDPAYLRFRLETQYGSDHDPEPDDVVTYLHWCRTFRHVA